MGSTEIDLLEYFRLKPTRVAKVSEISEATASSATPPEERVNFHIGNPLQERPLSSAFLRAVLGLDVRNESLTDDAPELLMEALEWPDDQRPALDLFVNLVRKSAPYLPRGGFNRANPPPLVTTFAQWLQNQQEPLTYELGKSGGKREIILSGGGVIETLRVLFHGLSGFLEHQPAHVASFHIQLPKHITSFDHLQFHQLSDGEQQAIAELRSHLMSHPAEPTFVLIGAQPSEEMRRSLRILSLGHPLFYIEANNAPNHASLAREVKLVDRVVRLLTPAIFSPEFSELPLVFVAGNADYLTLLETIHFQLKGTPSASEVELLTYLLRNPQPQKEAKQNQPIIVEPPSEGTAFELLAEGTIARAAHRIERHMDEILRTHSERVERIADTLALHVSPFPSRFQHDGVLATHDALSSLSALELAEHLERSIHDPSCFATLTASYLSSFVRHHPEYDPASCVVVSGSSRTALGLIGFHCGIREVVIPDLSWTYEHCFPTVTAVPLTPAFELDTDAIMETIKAKMATDPSWHRHGAFAINNPHNATGRVFNIAEVRRLVRWLLEHGLTVIDDLSYHNVAPSDELPDIPTVRQIANDLARTGNISKEQSDRVVTVHSMSKTDCLAGARLSVVEIRHRTLFEQFRLLNDTIKPNVGAILLTYLFYRNSLEVPRAVWRLRNRLFRERMDALADAHQNLPQERNPFGIEILAPTGSMYPLLLINHLPAGLSLDWIAAGLARQGIGMVPLSTFARTELGFETGRKAFRLTLGGTDDAATLQRKTRRVLIDLNRLIAEEEANYRRRTFALSKPMPVDDSAEASWKRVHDDIRTRIQDLLRKNFEDLQEELREETTRRRLTHEFVNDRLSVFRQRFLDRVRLSHELMSATRAGNGKLLAAMLEQELYKDNLNRRQEEFRLRSFDRTVHPTQMYSMQTEAAFDSIIAGLIRSHQPTGRQIETVSERLIREFLGLNVAITSSDEAEEVVLDLDAHIAAEQFTELQSGTSHRTLLSFWGDWDGSNRPSGQGHRLVASVLIANVSRLSHLLRLLVQSDPSVRITPETLIAMDELPKNIQQFTTLLNEITLLTHQLERRYRGVLPLHASGSNLRKLGVKLGLARDPLASMWYHNDRLERRMVEMRQERKKALEFYFSLNKQLRKELHKHIPQIEKNLGNESLAREASSYRDLLQRVVITPRIHQKMVTAQDPFAIDTTVFNINELNEIGARYGNPGVILEIQVSMSTKPEALISLDRKMHARREHILRDHSDIEMPSVWVVPLFEDIDAVRGITGYIDRLWEYALQSRTMNQDPADRFGEMVSEIFIAGSDLSQQVGQSAAARLYREAKHQIVRWLSEHHVAPHVRVKLGCGEPMQRQGGYYNDVSGRPAFVSSVDSSSRFRNVLRASTRRSTQYATTPMLGVFSGGDLRTMQSAISERMRHLSVADLSQLLFHLYETQRLHRLDLLRASEELGESRLRSTKRSEQALERLTIGTTDPLFDAFLKTHTENFRQILYGRDEDVVGIHIFSYFIARSTPPLRNRPTERASQNGKQQGTRIIERVAETIPFSKYGSLLRAIAHNQAQTVVLGINQLTTGLFRALDMFAKQEAAEGEAETIIADHILPNLPVYEILHTVRLYSDANLRFLSGIERALPAGNSALLALREDHDAMARYIPLFQQELLRRHGIDISDFFDEQQFLPELLPTLRPDLAVLMQPDLFNTSYTKLAQAFRGNVDPAWTNPFSSLLAIPDEINRWRAKIWNLLSAPITQRVESYVELAVALHSLASSSSPSGIIAGSRGLKLSSDLTTFFRMSRADDEMRQFLAGALEYLNAVSEGMVEIPANIVKAMKDVERIAKIEKQALTTEEQHQLRFYLLQIARLAGENG